MEAILTHDNADFDAVASQLGATKLFPAAVPVLSHRLNRNVQAFLDKFGADLPFVESRSLSGSPLSRVIIVDTQHFQTMRGMSKKTTVEVIDHHESNDAPKVNWQVTTEIVGATTTLIVERLKTQHVDLKPEEATLLLLGIYEDTGQLTYGTTTARDALSAAWLLGQGAEVDTVRAFLRQPLTDDQIALYQLLLSNVQSIQIDDDVILIATATTEKPVDEISTVVHRLRDTLEPSAIFVLVENNSSVQLVARSSTDRVDAGAIAGQLGGGGHRRAAAAIVPAQTIISVKAFLTAQLQQASKPKEFLVEEVMSRGVRILSPDATAHEADVQMRRYGFEGFPVLKNGTIVGLLTRRAVDRAISHEMTETPVSQLMESGQTSVSLGDALSTVRDVMKATGWGQIPVIDPDGGVVGVVTRTDLIKYADSEKPSAEGEVNLEDTMRKMLPRVLHTIATEAGLIASQQDSKLYIVGGVTRDLVLGYPISDFDFVVEGDAIKLTRSLAAMYGGRAVIHERFGTCKWLLDDNVWAKLASAIKVDLDPNSVLPGAIDFVTARTEYYTAPTRLPEVERSSIKHDLHRRDFTINTLAISLNPDNFGTLLDFYGGLADIGQKQIRVLHSLSFVDDPTRMLRAVRLERRLGFQIEPRTEALISSALPLLDHVSGDRIRHEIEAILEENQPEDYLPRLDELKILSALNIELTWTPAAAEGFGRIREAVADPLWPELKGSDLTLLYFGLWLYPLKAETVLAACERLKVNRRTAMTLEQIMGAKSSIELFNASLPPSEVDGLLANCEDLALLVLWGAASSNTARNQILDYACRLRYIAPNTTGETLKQRGLKPGRRYSSILGTLRKAWLDGAVVSNEDEEALLAKLLDQPETDQS